MRQILRILGIAALSLVSLETFIAIIDWFGRWEWLTSFIGSHRRVYAFTHTPFVYLALLVLGFLFLFAERTIKLPRIIARFVNSRFVPNVHTTPLKFALDTGAKKPGWDEHKIDWEWFLEVHIVNDSETPTTIEDVEVRVRIGKKWRKQVVPANCLEGFDKITMDLALDNVGEAHNKAYTDPRYRPVPNLMERIRNVPLTKGIGYRGWLRVEVPQVSQADIRDQRIEIDVWLIDALQGRHKLHYQKNSDRKWDKTFFILSE